VNYYYWNIINFPHQEFFSKYSFISYNSANLWAQYYLRILIEDMIFGSILYGIYAYIIFRINKFIKDKNIKNFKKIFSIIILFLFFIFYGIFIGFLDDKYPISDSFIIEYINMLFFGNFIYLLINIFYRILKRKKILLELLLIFSYIIAVIIIILIHKFIP